MDALLVARNQPGSTAGSSIPVLLGIVLAASVTACADGDNARASARLQAGYRSVATASQPSPDGTVAFEFVRVLGGGLLPDGSFFVVDDRDPGVQLFNQRGEWVERVARNGRGPGELRYPIRVGRVGGGSWLVYDGELRRALVYSSRMALLHTWERTTSSGSVIGGVDERRPVLLHAQVTSANDPPGFAAQVVSVLTAAGQSESVARLPRAVDGAGRTGQTERILLAAEGLVVVAAGSIISARTDSARLHWWSADSPPRVVELDLEFRRRTMTAEDKQRVHEQNLAETEWRAGRGGLSWVPVQIARLAVVANEWPFFDRLVGTAEGDAWIRFVRWPEEEESLWARVGPGGIQEEVRLGRYDEILDSHGERLLVRRRGEYDEHVVSVLTRSD
jgi:hypothetical protein